jgi:hypothetical protein
MCKSGPLETAAQKVDGGDRAAMAARARQVHRHAQSHTSIIGTKHAYTQNREPDADALLARLSDG